MPEPPESPVSRSHLMDRHVAVIGAGAMGSLFGGYLAESGVRVTLIDTGQEHVDTINDEGLVIETPERNRRVVDVHATTAPGTVDSVDLLVVFVKSHDTGAAIADASPLIDGTDVLTLQNGLGNPETLAEVVDEPAIIAGVTSHGSTLVGPGHVRHAGRGPTTLGRYFVDNDREVERIADLLTDADIETTVTRDVPGAIWEKVLVNVGINAATALARVPNGALADSEPGRRVLTSAIREAAVVAEAEGIQVRDDIVDHAVDVAERTGENRSSMWQDVESRRRTEIEALNGEIVRRGRGHDIETPVNAVLTDLVRLAEPRDRETADDGVGPTDRRSQRAGTGE